jgi:hypothetical protein
MEAAGAEAAIVLGRRRPRPERHGRRDAAARCLGAEPTHVRFDTAGTRAGGGAARGAGSAGAGVRGRPTIGVTGGRSASLARAGGDRERPRSTPRHLVVGEPEAIGAAACLAGMRRALVVSCGTGTAMIARTNSTPGTATCTPAARRSAAARCGRSARLLLGERDAHAIAASPAPATRAASTRRSARCSAAGSAPAGRGHRREPRPAGRRCRERCAARTWRPGSSR